MKLQQNNENVDVEWPASPSRQLADRLITNLFKSCAALTQAYSAIVQAAAFQALLRFPGSFFT